MQNQLRKSTNLSLDSALLQEARALKINLSRAAETGLQRAVSAAWEEKWKSENRAALESSNEFIAEHGLPLQKHRQF